MAAIVPCGRGRPAGAICESRAVEPTTLAAAAAAAFALAVLSAVAGFGGGVLLLPVFAALFGLRVAVPVLTLTQLVSNAARVGLNHRHLDWPVIRSFALGAVPTAAGAGLVFATAPLVALQRVLGAFLIAAVAWRRLRPRPRRPAVRSFVAIGAASGTGSALLGSVGPMTAPFFLAYGLVKDAYIGTEAASAVTMHVAKLAAYGAGDLLSGHVLALAAALTPATLLGAWVGKRVVHRLGERTFTLLVEGGLLVAGVLFLLQP
jgi:uncharacterized membrane protein YfcA